MQLKTISEQETLNRMVVDIKKAVLTKISKSQVMQTTKQLFTEGVTSNDEYYLWMRIAQMHDIKPQWNGRLIPCYFFSYANWEMELRNRIRGYFKERSFTKRDLEYYFDLSNPDSRGLMESTLQKLVYDHFLETTDYKRYSLLE